MLLIMKAMFSKMFNFFKFDKLSLYFILGLIALISVVVLYNSNTILSKFGFETTSSLKARVAQLEQQNQQLLQANNQLKDDLEKLEQRNKKELESMKKYYEYKLAQYNKVIKVQKDLKEKNIELSKELEEQRKSIAEVCKISEKNYYLYSNKTYDELSSNNHEAILTYLNFEQAKESILEFEKADTKKSFFKDFNFSNGLKFKTNKLFGDLK